MPSCWQEAISALYIGVTGRYRLTWEDRTMEANDQLTRLMRQLDTRLAALTQTVAETKAEAVALHRAGDIARCRSRFMDHKRAQGQLQRVAAYQDMVHQHMDALRNTELNKSLISTLQESSRTLKALGVMDGVKQAELVVKDVETSMMHAHELTSILGAPLASTASLDPSSQSQRDLELELEELLGLEPSAYEERAPVLLRAAEPMPTAAQPPEQVSNRMLLQHEKEEQEREKKEKKKEEDEEERGLGAATI